MSPSFGSLGLSSCDSFAEELVGSAEFISVVVVVTPVDSTSL